MMPSFKQERSVKHKRNFGVTKHYYICMNFCAIHSILPLVGVTSSIPMVKPWNPFGEYTYLSDFQKVRKNICDGLPFLIRWE